jgi:hypothetical protein
MIAPPHYKVETLTLDKVNGIKRLEKALEIIQTIMAQKKGTFKLTSDPQIMGAKDDKELEDLLANVKENQDAEVNSDIEEDNEEGIDIDIDDIEEDNDEEEKKEDSDDDN